jgi:hypothetical protein
MDASDDDKGWAFDLTGDGANGHAPHATVRSRGYIVEVVSFLIARQLGNLKIRYMHGDPLTILVQN